MDPFVDLYLNTDLTQQQIADKLGCSRKKVKNTLLRHGVELKAKRQGIGGRKRDSKWRDLVLESCERKNMKLLQDCGYPARNERLLVSCTHHPEGRFILVRDIISSKHCCHAGNSQSEEWRDRKRAELTARWDDPAARIPLLRNSSGHYGSESTKLYICRIQAKDGSSVLKFGRSERGPKRFGSFLVKEIWEIACPTSIARDLEIYAHLKFSHYSLEVELETSGSTECYKDSLPVEEVIKFFEESLESSS